MRRLTCLLLLAAVSVGAAGCTGGDAKRAQALLLQSQGAQQSIRSEGFAAQLSIDGAGRSGGFAMQGGAELEGANAGDFYVSGQPSGALGAQASQFDFTVVRRGSTITVRTPAGTRTMPAPPAQPGAGKSTQGPAAILDLARYVKSVSVGSTTLDGAPVDRIVGKIDTSKLVGSLGGLDKNALAQQLLHRLGVQVGDVDVVLFLDRGTHLVRVMLADMDVGARGNKAHVHLSIVLNRVNQPVDFPSP